jgi:putative DNA primase/helicase
VDGALPAHDDREPSLSISAGKNGKVLVRCHAGCDQRDVIAALQRRGLWQAIRRLSGPVRNDRCGIVEDLDPDALQRTEAALAI